MKFDSLQEQLCMQLNEIKNQNSNIIKQADLSITACRSILSEMSKIISNSSFIDETDEINFFKKIKIQPLSQLVYFSELRSFEIQYPKACYRDQIEYLEKKIRKVNKFFNYNIEFIQYVRQDKTNLDSSYYIRANYNSLNITDTKSYYRAPDFSTSHDILLGKVKGFDLFINYLQNRLFHLQNPDSTKLHDIHKASKLKWTSTKIALTELIYALHSSGAINSGAADIKEIASMTERLFNVDLGDYYRTYLEIKMRKIDRVKFIDTLKASLLNRMEEAEE